jgi:hypothetical protein
MNEGWRKRLPDLDDHCLVFARPSYGGAPDRACDNSHLAAIMFASNKGVKWAGPICPDREGWREARNHVVSETLQYVAAHQITGVFWVDDDIVLPFNAITRLLEHGLDFVAGLYFQRAAPYLPVAAGLGAGGDFDFWWDFPRNVLAPVDGVGFGCVYTSIKLLQTISDTYDCVPFTQPAKGKSYGEDFLFCLRAKSVGFQPHVDTGILCKHHLDSRYVDLELFEKFRGQLLDPAQPGLRVVKEGAEQA